MNTNYRINAAYATGRALAAVQSWEDALKEQTKKSDAEGIAFCTASLVAAKSKLTKILEDVQNEHVWN